MSELIDHQNSASNPVSPSLHHDHSPSRPLCVRGLLAGEGRTDSSSFSLSSTSSLIFSLLSSFSSAFIISLRFGSLDAADFGLPGLFLGEAASIPVPAAAAATSPSPIFLSFFSCSCTARGVQLGPNSFAITTKSILISCVARIKRSKRPFVSPCKVKSQRWKVDARFCVPFQFMVLDTFGVNSLAMSEDDMVLDLR